MSPAAQELVLGVYARDVRQVSHGGTIHRTTTQAVHFPAGRFPVAITTDIGNAQPAMLKALSLCKPVHAVYHQQDSNHCIVVVEGE